MKDNTTLFYKMSSPETLSDPARIEGLLDLLIQQGYLLLARSENLAVSLAWTLQLDPPWPQWDSTERAKNQALAAPYQAQIFVPGITEQLRREVERFKTRQQPALQIYARATAQTGSLHGLEFNLDLAPAGTYLSLNYTNDFFTSKRNEQARVEAFNHWLEIIEGLYNLFHPIYAYAWNQNGSIPATEETYLEQRTPYTLYEINLFGPEMVENMGGRAYLLKTPALFVRELSDNGVLIIPDLPWYPSPVFYTWRKVANYLGVVCPDFALDDDDE